LDDEGAGYVSGFHEVCMSLIFICVFCSVLSFSVVIYWVLGFGIRVRIRVRVSYFHVFRVFSRSILIYRVFFLGELADY